MEEESAEQEEGDANDVEIVSGSEESEFSFDGELKASKRSVSTRSRIKTKGEASSPKKESKKKKKVNTSFLFISSLDVSFLLASRLLNAALSSCVRLYLF